MLYFLLREDPDHPIAGHQTPEVAQTATPTPDNSDIKLEFVASPVPENTTPPENGNKQKTKTNEITLEFPKSISTADPIIITAIAPGTLKLKKGTIFVEYFCIRSSEKIPYSNSFQMFPYKNGLIGEIPNKFNCEYKNISDSQLEFYVQVRTDEKPYSLGSNEDRFKISVHF